LQGFFFKARRFIVAVSIDSRGGLWLVSDAGFAVCGVVGFRSNRI